MWADVIAYAEKYHVLPQTVEDTVEAVWWFRQQELDAARASRRAWEHYDRAQDPIKELTKAEQRAKDWALRE